MSNDLEAIVPEKMPKFILPGATVLRKRLCTACDDLTIHSGKSSGLDMTYHCNNCGLVTTVELGEIDELA